MNQDDTPSLSEDGIPISGPLSADPSPSRRLENFTSCDAVPDDQPNDIHLHYFNEGVKAAEATEATFKKREAEIRYDELSNVQLEYSHYDQVLTTVDNKTMTLRERLAQLKKEMEEV